MAMPADSRMMLKTSKGVDAGPKSGEKILLPLSLMMRRRKEQSERQTFLSCVTLVVSLGILLLNALTMGLISVRHAK